MKWFKENRLHLNVKKIKWSLLGTCQNYGKTVITINVADNPLEQKEINILAYGLIKTRTGTIT